MPRHPAGPRLYLRKGRKDSRTGQAIADVWFIRDGPLQRSTGLPRQRRAEALRVLQAYVAQKEAKEQGALTDDARRDPAKVLIADVLAYYAKERAPELRTDPASMAGFIKNLADWWKDRSLSDIKRSTCKEYVDHRTSQPNRRATVAQAPKMVSPETARRELEVLSAAVGFWDAENRLTWKPKITLPKRPESSRDALTRSQAAALLKAATGYRRRPDGCWERLGKSAQSNRRHLARVILLSLYTGSRPSVVRRLLWEPSATHPWVDLNTGVIYRRGKAVREERNKRTPVVKIPPRLLAHMRRWRRMDTALEARRRDTDPDFQLNAVIHHGGSPLAGKIRTGFEGCVRDAGLPREVTPHWLRHTAATLLMEANVDIWKAAGFLGMTVEILERHYAHHRPHYQSEAISAFGKRSKAPPLASDWPGTAVERGNKA